MKAAIVRLFQCTDGSQHKLSYGTSANTVKWFAFISKLQDRPNTCDAYGSADMYTHSNSQIYSTSAQCQQGQATSVDPQDRKDYSAEPIMDILSALQLLVYT